MKLLFFDLFTQVGGVPTVAGRIINGLAQLGTECIVVDAFGDSADVMRLEPQAGVRVEALPLDESFRRISLQHEEGRLRTYLRLLRAGSRFLIRLVHLVRSTKADAIYCHLPKSGVAAVLVSLVTGVPLVFHSHGVEDLAHIGLLYRMVLRRAHHVFCVSEGTRQQMLAVGVGSERLTVVYNGLEPLWFEAPHEAPPLRSEFQLTGAITAFGFVGNLINRKGVDILVDGFARFVQQLPKEDRERVKLIVVGADPQGDEGPYITALRTRAEEGGCSRHILFAGKRSDILAFMRSIDVFVLPARMESFGVVLIEAMSQGLPVISTNTSSIPEVVSAEHTGILVDRESPAQLAAALRRVFDDPELRRTLGAQARAEVARRFDQRALTRLLWETLRTRVL